MRICSKIWLGFLGFLCLGCSYRFSCLVYLSLLLSLSVACVVFKVLVVVGFDFRSVGVFGGGCGSQVLGSFVCSCSFIDIRPASMEACRCCRRTFFQAVHIL